MFVKAEIDHGKLKSWRKLENDLYGIRKWQFNDFKKRYQIDRLKAWVSQHNFSTFVNIVPEGPGEDFLFDELARSTHRFDIWYRKNLEHLLNITIQN
ncbi:MAG: hypothetical protein KDD94_05020 [Calditrichaeota bacterium]|nr:hypothetical protein [Calditrichota bacterium]